MNARVPVTPEHFDPARFPARLNLGCGLDHREGYLNVDLHAWHEPDLVADIRNISFLPAQYYDEIVAQDVLEHLPRTDTLRTLAHWNRPLKVGGRIFLRIPSIQGVAELLRRPDNQAPARQEELIQFLFGTQAYTGDFHLTSFTESLLRHYLERAGFRLLTIELVHDWLYDVTAEKVEHIEAPPVRDFSELKAIERDEDFVRTCYREILQRDADPSGLHFYVSGLAAGSMDRQRIIELMLASGEYAVIRRKSGFATEG